MRWHIWHEERGGYPKKAEAGTNTQILHYNQPYSSWSNLYGSNPIGTYHENGNPDSSTPYTWVKVYAKQWNDKGNAAWSVSQSASRRSSQTAYSRHTASVRYNNQDRRSLIYEHYYLP